MGIIADVGQVVGTVVAHCRARAGAAGQQAVYHRTRATAYKMWNANDNQPDYDVFKAAVDKLGRTPGFNEALPAPGEVFQGEDTATVTIKYIDNFGKTIAADDVFYGLNDSEYHFEAKELFGYSFIESDLPLDGKYNGNMTITLKYQLHCDKTDLKKEIFEPLAVSEYINETVADYNKALTMAKEIYFDETSGQLAVNNALRALQDAKNKAVKLEYYSLYVEVTYPLNESDYSSGYQAYKNAVTTGKTLLNSEGLTVEKAKEAYNAIQTAKQSLVKPNAKVPTISATDTYYQSNNYNNMIDGNINTKCWFNSNQEIGKEVKFTFTRPINISSIQIIQPSNAGEDIIDGADVQISTDGKNWTTVGTLDNSAFEKTITFDKTLTKYVRIVLTEGKGNWYQIAEVKFELEEIPEDSTLKDMILEAETLNITGKSSGSVNEMIDALIVAQKSYVEGKVDVTEETNNLRNAINALRDTFSEYQIPSEAYNCIKLYKDDIYEILFGNANYIDNLCKRSLVNICESEYVRDWTQRISYLFDTFDGIDPRNYNKEKVIKLVFTILAIDKADYLRNKQKYEQLKNKYRNPILHGGKSIFEIEPDINEIKKVDTYLRKTIMDYCLKIHSLSISTWEELDNAYRVQQNFLKL